MNRVRNRRLQYSRLAAQVLGLVLTVIGYYYVVVRGFGVPKWLFVGSVIVAGLFFCGWFCPFGTVQEWLRHLGKKIGLNLAVPTRVNRYLSFSRYLLIPLSSIAFFSFLDSRRIFISAITGDIAAAGALAILAAILLLSLAVDRPFCRYLCGFGAIHGLFSMARVLGLRRDAVKCVGCRKCDKACMMGVEVSLAHAVRDPHCINCGKCMGVCPVPGALTAGVTIPSRVDVTALHKKYVRPGKERLHPPLARDEGDAAA